MLSGRRLATFGVTVAVLFAGAVGGYLLGGTDRHRAPALRPLGTTTGQVAVGRLRSPVTVPALRPGGG